jgi:hypothetical protein
LCWFETLRQPSHEGRSVFDVYINKNFAIHHLLLAFSVLLPLSGDLAWISTDNRSPKCLGDYWPIFPGR